MAAELFIGIMSGTSLDAVDAVVCRFTSPPNTASVDGVQLEVVASHSRPLPTALRQQLLAITDSASDAEARSIGLAELAQLEATLGELYAATTTELLATAGLTAGDIAAIGCHGQTVMHLPPPQQPAATLQLNDPSRLAALSGIAVVADFRRADVALGGQGAPLVPAFHRALFGSSRHRAICNIGGIANLTFVDGEQCSGFDSGPGNALMDSWCQRHRGERYDRDGSWAAQGQVDEPLLATLLAHPYLAMAPPKSCGREQFNQQLLEGCTVGAADVQATLAEFTAATIANALASRAGDIEELYVCGGGAYNSHLMSRLAARLPGCAVASTAALGLPPEWVEASAFGWLARQRLLGLPGNLPAVTGASRPTVLGGLFLP
jgi:anhydro-N-acetylmuramic acid kinase